MGLHGEQRISLVRCTLAGGRHQPKYRNVDLTALLSAAATYAFRALLIVIVAAAVACTPGVPYGPPQTALAGLSQIPRYMHALPISICTWLCG